MSIYNQYKASHFIKDLRLLESVIVSKYPQYAKSVESFLHFNNKMFKGNMFVSSKEFWNNYHTWAFDILFEMEKCVELYDNPYQRRVLGFLSERMLNIYIFHNKTQTMAFKTLFIDSY
jgi:hypothetical protein